jgi:hypothetical protein
LGAKRGLLSAKPSVRSHALEYLDHALNGDLHRMVFNVIGDDPVQVKLQKAEKAFKLKRTNLEGTVRRILLRGLGHSDEPAMLICAALQIVRAQSLHGLYPLVLELEPQDMPPLVVETYSWVCAYISKTTVRN